MDTGQFQVLLEDIHAKVQFIAEGHGVLRADIARLERRFDKSEAQVEARFDKVDARFDKMDARFDKMDARFDKMDARLTKVEKLLDKREGKAPQRVRKR